MKMKICMVDETSDLLDNRTQFLEMEGHEIWAYRNGAGALQRMRNESPDLTITILGCLGWME